MTTYSKTGSGSVYAPRATQKALEQEVIDRFLSRASALGMSPKPLSIKVLGGGLMGLWETPGTFRVSWRRELRVAIPGIASFTMRLPQSGVFTKYNADKVLMSVEAEAYRLPLSTLHEIEETAVLAEEVGSHPGGEGGRTLVRGVPMAQAALRAHGRGSAAPGVDQVAARNTHCDLRSGPALVGPLAFCPPGKR